MENLAHYIIRASFSQERMTYLPEESKVIYEPKACPRRRPGNSQGEKVFDALEWLAAMSSHEPDKGEQKARPLYFSRSSAIWVNKESRGLVGENEGLL